MSNKETKYTKASYNACRLDTKETKKAIDDFFFATTVRLIEHLSDDDKSEFGVFGDDVLEAKRFLERLEDAEEERKQSGNNLPRSMIYEIVRGCLLATLIISERARTEVILKAIEDGTAGEVPEEVRRRFEETREELNSADVQMKAESAVTNALGASLVFALSNALPFIVPYLKRVEEESKAEEAEDEQPQE